MVPMSISLWSKVFKKVKSLTKFLGFGSRQSTRSSTRSTTLCDSWSQKDSDTTTLSLHEEKELTFVVDLEPNMWREILSYCEVVDIVHVGMACRSLASVTQDHRVWYFALLRISYDRRLPYLCFRIRSLSPATLRQKAILSARLDHISRGLGPRPSPYTTTMLSLPVSAVWGISFLPGGEWLVVLCRMADEDGILLRRTGEFGEPCAYLSVSDWSVTNMCIFTSDKGDLLLLLRSDRSDVTKLAVYSVHPLDSCPSLELMWTAEIPEVENCAALGNYIVHGWIDRSDVKPRHLVRVLRLDSSYRELVEYCTVEVEWEVGKWPHSYGLRKTDSQITVMVSSTKLIAAYKVPFMIPSAIPCEPMTIAPFWRFSCAPMNPRAVYLVPSLPAVDTPSIVILYGSRCLFIAPSFDTDPLQRHPTYFSTYTYPRELKRPMLLGPHRAFWDLGRGRVGIGMLPAPATPAFCERGAWDMTGIHTPEANLANEVYPLGHAGLCGAKVARAAWDEESGRLVLCPRAESLLVIVNLMP